MLLVFFARSKRVLFVQLSFGAGKCCEGFMQDGQKTSPRCGSGAQNACVFKLVVCNSAAARVFWTSHDLNAKPSMQGVLSSHLQPLRVRPIYLRLPWRRHPRHPRKIHCTSCIVAMVGTH